MCGPAQKKGVARMVQLASALRITLSDVALLTKVQRPVVSMWRSRSRGTDTPFPEPVDSERGQEIFDAGQILDWLAATGRGNNPDFREDAAAFAVLDAFRRRPRELFDGVTAMLVLRRLTAGQLGGLDAEDLLDAADEWDPDDTFIYGELEALGPDLESAAAYTDLITDAAYSPEAAFERLMSERFRAGLREHGDTALTDEAVELAAVTAVELSGGTEAPVFVDSTRGGSDLLLGIVARLDESRPATLLTSDDDGGASRLVRRRLRVHGVHRQNLAVDSAGTFSVSGPTIHVAQYPSPGDPSLDAAGILSAIENIVLQMEDDQRAVVIGPAAVLADAASSHEVEDLRSDLLRSGRIRAAVRLPQGLLKAKPRQAQALWVLGPAHQDVDIAERWTMVADLSGRELAADVRQDLISDLAASMGSHATIRAHAFRFARLVLTSRLLAGRGALVAPAARPVQNSPGEDAAVRLDALLHSLNEQPEPEPLAISTEAGAPEDYRRGATIAELLRSGRLKYLPGNRLQEADLADADDGALPGDGAPVIGPAELLGQAAPGSRRIGQLAFARYPAGRRTEPGDVIFCTGPRPAAVVDTEGAAVVAYPARALRINGKDPGGLLAEILATDINAVPAGRQDWKRWPVRRVPEAQRPRLEAALRQLAEERRRARQRLTHLDELTTLLTDAVAAGSLRLSPANGTIDPDPTEGS